MFDQEWGYQLSPDALIKTSDLETITIPYTDIRTVHLLTYPGMSAQVYSDGAPTLVPGAKQGQLALTTHQNGKIIVRSHHYLEMGRFENRATSYAPFVKGLIEHVVQTNPDAQFFVGSSVFQICLFIVFFILTGAFLALLFLLFEGTYNFMSLLFALVFIGPFIPLTWYYAYNSGKSQIDPANIEDELIHL